MCKMGVLQTSTLIKWSCLGVLLGSVLFIIGFSTVYWVLLKRTRNDLLSQVAYGLWSRRVMVKDGRDMDVWQDMTSFVLKILGWTDWYRATQVFECLGLICQVVAFIICLIYVFMDRMKKRFPLLTYVLFCFAAAACMIIGFAIYISKLQGKHSFDVGWSLGISIAGCILTAIAGLLGFIELCR